MPRRRVRGKIKSITSDTPDNQPGQRASSWSQMMSGTSLFLLPKVWTKFEGETRLIQRLAFNFSNRNSAKASYDTQLVFRNTQQTVQRLKSAGTHGRETPLPFQKSPVHPRALNIKGARQCWQTEMTSPLRRASAAETLSPVAALEM